MADALSRIRNAYFRSFQDVIVVDSKEIRELLNALIHAGYIHNWTASFGGKTTQLKVEGGSIKVSLKYFQNMPAMRGIQQISSPGKRTYMSMKRILKYSEEQNWGENKTLFLSTSQGIMNHREILISFDNGGAKPLDPKGQTSYGNSEGYAFQSTELPSLHSNGCKGPGVEGGEALCLIW
jgi:ribosomal protein S8